jgi:hypothetical protein
MSPTDQQRAEANQRRAESILRCSRHNHYSEGQIRKLAPLIAKMLAAIEDSAEVTPVVAVKAVCDLHDSLNPVANDVRWS